MASLPILTLTLSLFDLLILLWTPSTLCNSVRGSADAGHGHESPSRIKGNWSQVHAGENKNLTKRWIKLALEEEPHWLDLRRINMILRGRYQGHGKGPGFLDMTGLNLYRQHLEPELEYKEPVGNETVITSIRFKEKVTSLISKIHLKGMKQFMLNLTTHFRNRLATSREGERAGDWLHHILTYIAEHSKFPVTIWEWSSPTWEYGQRSIFARINGSTDEIVILGANMDSINLHQDRWRCRDLFHCPGMDAPGAEDNASGVTVLLEAFRLITNKFGLVEGGLKRSIEFHWYAAGEYGLRGSLVTAEAYRQKGLQVVGMLSVAQAGYAPSFQSVYGPFDNDNDSNSTPNPKDSWKVAIHPRETDPGLSDFLRLLVKTYLEVDWEDKIFCVGCYSDYASWTEFGYPSAFAYGWEYSPHLWRRSDTMDKVNWDYLIQFVRLAVGFAVELGEPMPDY